MEEIQLFKTSIETQLKIDLESENLDDVLLEYSLEVIKDEDGGEDLEEIWDSLKAYLPFLIDIDLTVGTRWIQQFRTELKRRETVRRESEASTSSQKNDDEFHPEDLRISESEQTSCGGSNGNQKTKSDVSSSMGMLSLDEDLKKAITESYSYRPESGAPVSKINVKSRPTKPECKTRYLDGQVVSTKGGRYLEEKKAVSEEMKGTYVNLKPLKQRWLWSYNFLSDKIATPNITDSKDTDRQQHRYVGLQRPRNAHNFFVSFNFDHYRLEYDYLCMNDPKFRKIQQIMKRDWNQLSLEDRKVYQDLADEEIREYERKKIERDRVFEKAIQNRKKFDEDAVAQFRSNSFDDIRLSYRRQASRTSWILS